MALRTAIGTPVFLAASCAAESHICASFTVAKAGAPGVAHATMATITNSASRHLTVKIFIPVALTGRFDTELIMDLQFLLHLVKATLAVKPFTNCNLGHETAKFAVLFQKLFDHGTRFKAF